jgi:hypothetical protein
MMKNITYSIPSIVRQTNLAVPAALLGVAVGAAGVYRRESDDERMLIDQRFFLTEGFGTVCLTTTRKLS